MIHYHGLPITPATACMAAVNGGHAFVSCSTWPDQPLDPSDQGIADEYIELLRVIDEAMGEPK